jgi:hypothetical protein
MISVDPDLDELLVLPMPPIITPPDFSIDDPARDRSTRKDDRPAVPCLRPGWRRVPVHHGLIVVVGNHGLLFKNQSRRAEFNRPIASPCWVRMGGGNIRCRQRYRFRATPQRKSLVKLNTGLRVDPGTVKQIGCPWEGGLSKVCAGRPRQR